MGLSAALAARRLRAVESFGNAQDAIGPIVPGMSLFAITRGQWSMIDAILHCLDQIGTAKSLSLWTWTVAQYEVDCLDRLRIDQRIQSARLIIDKGAQVKNATIIRDWQSRFGDDAVRWVMNHAKMALIESEGGLKLLLRGSMNLNFNPRFEQFDLTEGGADYDLVSSIEDDLPAFDHDPSYPEIVAASRVSAAFSEDQLSLFGKLKTWAK